MSFVAQVEQRILPQYSARLVKSTGDGFLAEFEDARDAVAAALAIQAAVGQHEAGIPEAHRIYLCVGVELGNFVADDRDVYGHGVNLAARLGSLAHPGEVVVSATVRDRITDGVDADIEDLGERYVKNITEPIHAYRVTPPGLGARRPRAIRLAVLQPTIAVLPFVQRHGGHAHEFIGDVFADEMTEMLSRSQSLNVISRLSTVAFRGRASPLPEIHRHLHVNYVLAGSYWIDGGRIEFRLELVKAPDDAVVWSHSLSGAVDNAFPVIREAVADIASGVSSTIVRQELVSARLKPLPTLESYTLLLSAIALMHRQTQQDFLLAQDVLQELISRMPRHPVPRAWLAHWQVLKVQQGWSTDIDRDRGVALEQTKRALDIDPENALALTTEGLVVTHFLKRLDVALERYEAAVTANPNSALSWLLKGTMHAFMDQGTTAVENTERAMALSPLDQHRYYFESLAATSSLAAGENEQALDLAQRSLKANRRHSSTLRVIIAAQWRLERYDEARETARELMRVEPRLTVSGWLERSPSASFKLGEEFSVILRNVGVPE